MRRFAAKHPVADLSLGILNNDPSLSTLKEHDEHDDRDRKDQETDDEQR